MFLEEVSGKILFKKKNIHAANNFVLYIMVCTAFCYIYSDGELFMYNVFVDIKISCPHVAHQSCH